jgi:hypothetical protein
MLLAIPACAADLTDTGSSILNGQVNVGNVVSTMTSTTANVYGDVSVQSVAVGNLLDVTTMNDTSVNNSQYVKTGEIGSYLGAAATDVSGSVSVTGQAICNAASVSTDPTVTSVTNLQQCYGQDPASVVYVDAINVGGSVSIANSAIANTFEADSNAANMPIDSTQVNNTLVTATTTANVKNVAGSVAISATAVGNSAQIVHYSTD